MSKPTNLFLSNSLLKRISESQKILSSQESLTESQRIQLLGVLADMSSAVSAYDRSFIEHSDNVQVAIAQAFDSCAYLARNWPARQVLNEGESRIAKLVAESIADELKSHAFE